jgi:uncharacterized protein (DUF486 family)
MENSRRKPWLRAAVILGVVYFVIGIAFGVFASRAASNSMRVTWNRLAFLASAVVFAVHIAYEHFRLGNSTLKTAWHVSIAVALGGFLLAVNANVHGFWVGSSNQRLLALALVAWPALTAVPAFVVALVASAGLNLRRRSP